MPKPRIAIVTTYMDRRPAKGTAIVIRRLVQELRAYRDQFDITLVHEQPIPEDPLYQEFRELIISQKAFPKYRRFLSEVWFFLTTRERFDIWYQPYSRLYPLFWLAPAKQFMFMLGDGGPQTAGYQEQAKGRAPRLIQRFFPKVAAFIAISEFGRKGILQTYDIPAEKVHVVYNGVDERFSPLNGDKHLLQQELQQRYGMSTPFILDVSRFDPHKNILRVLDVYKELIDRYRIPHALVFVGGRHMPDYSAKVDQRIQELGLEKRVVVTPLIPDEDLLKFYQASDVLFFPSLYEGFGLPVVEAMSCGLPVVASSVGSLPEVVGEAGHLVDPYAPHEMVEAVYKVLSDTVYREQLIEKGYVQASRFSWKKMTQQTIEIFQRLLA